MKTRQEPKTLTKATYEELVTALREAPEKHRIAFDPYWQWWDRVQVLLTRVRPTPQ